MKRKPRDRSIVGEFAAMARALVEANDGKEWPAEKWQKDPVGFAETILGVRLWSFQVEFLEAIRDNPRVAVAGGRKIGKDFAVAVAALWWYASFPKARVFMTAVTSKQIRDILYLEIRQRISEAGVCLGCRSIKDPSIRSSIERERPCSHSAILTGKVGQLPSTGIVSPDFREIKGVVAKSGEGMQGYSGARLLALIDEASLVPEDLHVAIRGNLAAEWCREVLIGNPTRSKGFFADAFKKGLYRTLQVSSTTGPNIVEGREVFPGLASRRWLQEQKDDWGEDSPLYKIHVLGQFVENEQGSIFPVHTIAEAVARWAETPDDGPLQLGIDPAGEGGKGDESGFSARRGKKILAVTGRRGLTPDGHVTEALGIIASHGTGGERVRVVVDREGETGAKVWGAFVAYVQAHPDCPIDLVGLRSSERAHRQPLVYDRVRDELCAVLADWLRDGGALPDDPKLAKDLTCFRWVEHVSGRTKALSKDKIREELGRSPDRADAVQLSCWGSAQLGATSSEATRPAETRQHDAFAAPHDRTFDPYAGMRGFRR